jgi:hypothetical protein
VAKFQTKAYTGVRPIPQPDSAGARCVVVDVEFPTTVPVANDLIQLCKLPVGVKCIDWALVFPDIDSNGAPAFAASLGIENVGGTDLGAEVWGTGLTAGQSTSIVRNSTSVAAQGDTTTERTLDLKVTTAAATYAGAGKTGQVLLWLQG